VAEEAGRMKGAAMLPVSPALLEDEPSQEFVKAQLRDLVRANGGSEPFKFWVQWSWAIDPESGEKIDIPYMLCEGPASG
jgi:hypothetical protein